MESGFWLFSCGHHALQGTLHGRASTSPRRSATRWLIYRNLIDQRGTLAVASPEPARGSDGRHGVPNERPGALRAGLDTPEPALQPQHTRPEMFARPCDGVTESAPASW